MRYPLKKIKKFFSKKSRGALTHLGSVIGSFFPYNLASSSDGVNAITLLFEKSLTFLVMI